MIENMVFLDCEVFPNYFLVTILRGEEGDEEVEIFDCYSEDNRLFFGGELEQIMRENTTCGFNSIAYDLKIIHLILSGATCKEVYEESKLIIGGKKSCSTMTGITHCDLFHVLPGVGVSLKLYGARIHSVSIQDMPQGPHELVDKKDVKRIKEYCLNDVKITQQLFELVKDRVLLREELGRKHSKDLLSKSDAQISELIMRSELLKVMAPKDLFIKGDILGPHYENPRNCFTYSRPIPITFVDKELKRLYKIICNAKFHVNKKGLVEVPPEIENLKVKIGNKLFKIRLGGLHSQEKTMVLKSDADNQIIASDVVSYYPHIILNCKLFPFWLHKFFGKIYESLVKERVLAKSQSNHVLSSTLKIVINGAYGKFGSPYSVMYCPYMMIHVTLTGQLLMLSLIEDLYLKGIQVSSCNTDGIVSVVKKSLLSTYEDVCRTWELYYDLTLTDSKIHELYYRDINNYLGIGGDGHKNGLSFSGEILKKGIFNLGSLTKNPRGEICLKAIRELIVNQVPIRKTILGSGDIKDFLFVRKVTGGAIQERRPLGKVARWYYSLKGSNIHYVKNNNVVPETDKCTAVVSIKEYFGNYDINYDKYISYTEEILKDIGFYKELSLFDL